MSGNSGRLEHLDRSSVRIIHIQGPATLVGAFVQIYRFAYEMTVGGLQFLVQFQEVVHVIGHVAATRVIGSEVLRITGRSQVLEELQFMTNADFQFTTNTDCQFTTNADSQFTTNAEYPI